ncbi:MAG: hypothetical protein ACPG52_04925 [Cognaticolwellia sp.]
MKNFWRVPVQNKDDIEAMIARSNLIAPADIFHKIKPKHGIVLSEWDDSSLIGKVVAFGVVTSVNILEQ